MSHLIPPPYSTSSTIKCLLTYLNSRGSCSHWPISAVLYNFYGCKVQNITHYHLKIHSATWRSDSIGTSKYLWAVPWGIPYSFHFLLHSLGVLPAEKKHRQTRKKKKKKKNLVKSKYLIPPEKKRDRQTHWEWEKFFNSFDLLSELSGQIPHSFFYILIATFSFFCCYFKSWFVFFFSFIPPCFTKV